MKLPKIISLFVFTFFALVSIAQKKEIPTRYALCPGFNVSNLYNDSSRTVKTTYPQFGFIINKDFNSAFGVNGGMQFSYRGANREGLSYKFRNTYLDFQVIPKYSLFDFLKLEIGGQYSYLMTSKLITRTPFNGKIKTDIYGKYKSQFELIAGLDFFFQDNASINLKYSIPLQNSQYSNFQITLNVYLEKQLSRKKDTINEDAFAINLLKKDYFQGDYAIYPRYLSKPPEYSKDGKNLYSFMQDEIHLLPSDFKTNRKNPVSVVYEVSMDSLGKVKSISIVEASLNSNGRRFQKGNLSNQIMQKIKDMPPWNPAMINGKPVDVVFYLPMVIWVQFSSFLVVTSTKYNMF